MPINKSKSGIMTNSIPIWNLKKFIDFPVIESYKYLRSFIYQNTKEVRNNRKNQVNKLTY